MFTQRLLSLVLVVMAIGSCADKVDFPERGISKKLADQRKSTISNVSYQLHFDIPESSQEPIEGKLKLGLKIKSGSPLILDFDTSSGAITHLRKDGEDLPYDLTNGHIVIEPEYVDEQDTIEIEFIAGNGSLNRKDDYLYTLFVPARASECFPVFDQPNLKAKYSLSLKIPKQWKAISNGAIISAQESNGKMRVEFSETKEISSYLFAFVVGEFDQIKKEIGGRKFTLLHRETDAEKVEMNVNAIFNWHVKSLDWLEDYTGINYPFDKFGFVLLPSFQFGGMEHPGAIYYKASSLFLEESHGIQQEKNRARLIAHETAHMWFGDLVTMDWFDDVWLKEAFANFMAAKITQQGFPSINHDLQFLMSHYPSAYEVDRTRGSHPITQPLDNLNDAGSLYGAIIYQKAPIVMRMLEENMGADHFRHGMHQYLKKYSFNNATWDELIAILENNTDYKLSIWNEHWVKSPRMPRIFYNLRESQDRITRYNVYTAIRDDEEKIWWPQKITVELGLEDSLISMELNKTSRVTNLDEVKGLPKVKYLFNNAGGLGYGYFSMDKNSVDHYLQHIDQEGSDLKRGALWINFHEMAIRGDIDPLRLVKAQMTSLNKETEPFIVSYLLRSIRQLYWVYIDRPARSELSAQLEGVLLNSLLKADALSRNMYFDALKNIVASEKGIEVLNSIYMGKIDVEGFELSESDKVSLAYEIAVRIPEKSVELLQSQLELIKNPDTKKRMAFVMQALHPDLEKRQDFFEGLKEPANRANEEWVLEALNYLHHPLRVHETIGFIRPSLDLLEEIKNTGDIFFPQRWLDNTLQYHYTEEARDAVQQFLYRHNKYPEDLKNKILQSADHLFRSVSVRNNWEERRQSDVEERG